MGNDNWEILRLPEHVHQAAQAYYAEEARRLADEADEDKGRDEE